MVCRVLFVVFFFVVLLLFSVFRGYTFENGFICLFACLLPCLTLRPFHFCEILGMYFLREGSHLYDRLSQPLRKKKILIE